MIILCRVLNSIIGQITSLMDLDREIESFGYNMGANSIVDRDVEK